MILKGRYYAINNFCNNAIDLPVIFESVITDLFEEALWNLGWLVTMNFMINLQVPIFDLNVNGHTQIKVINDSYFWTGTFNYFTASMCSQLIINASTGNANGNTIFVNATDEYINNKTWDISTDQNYTGSDAIPVSSVDALVSS